MYTYFLSILKIRSISCLTQSTKLVRKLMKVLSVCLKLLFTLTLTLGLLTNTFAAPKAGKICSGPETGIYYQYVGGIIDAAKATLDLNLENVATQGSLENAKAIATGQCDMAIVQADLYIQSGADFQATPEAKLFSTNLGTLAALYPESVHLLVNKDSGIKSIADLAGKKVNVGEKDSGTFFTAYKLLNVYHSLAKSPEYSYEAPADAVAKVADGSLDATFYVAGAPVDALSNLPKEANVTLIPVTIAGFTWDYTTLTIPANTYPWLTQDVENNVAVWSLLTMGPGIDRTKIAKFLDELYANKTGYADKYHAKWAELDKATSIANIKTNPINGWDYEVAHYFAGTPLPTDKPQPYFCSAGPHGTYTKVVQDLLPIVNDILGMKLVEKSTAGSLENMIGLYNGECAMILNQEDVGFYAMSIDHTMPTISKELLMAMFVRTLMPLYGEDVHLVVNTQSGIESSQDLAGKKINMGEKLSGTFVTATGALLVNGINKAELSYDSPEAALPKVIAGEYDAMFVTGRAPISYLASATCPKSVAGCSDDTLPIKLVPVKTPDFLVKTTLSADLYPWQSEDIANSPQATTFFSFSPNLGLNAKQVAALIEAVYALKPGLSPTWEITNLKQGLAKFDVLPGYYSWLSGQYFVNQMK